jgi:hypothetical protein
MDIETKFYLRRKITEFFDDLPNWFGGLVVILFFARDYPIIPFSIGLWFFGKLHGLVLFQFFSAVFDLFRKKHIAEPCGAGDGAENDAENSAGHAPRA